MLTVLDQNLRSVLFIDTIHSMVWTERHGEIGELELKIPGAYSGSEYLVYDNMFIIPESTYIMVIEDINPIYDEEFGDSLTIKGRASESLLERRVPSSVVTINGDVQTALIGLVTDNFITPTNSKRNISFISTRSNPSITTTITDQFTVGTVYDIIASVCSSTGLGFRFVLENDKLVFELYSIADRSVNQIVNPPIIFSNKFDNIVSASYNYLTRGTKNVTLVVAEDEIPSLQRTFINLGSEPEGLHRRETFQEVKISRQVSGEPDLTDGEVQDIIKNKGVEQLSDLTPIVVFDGEFITTEQFIFGEDFFLGDVVQISIPERDVAAQVVEHVYSIEADSISRYVAFDYIL